MEATREVYGRRSTAAKGKAAGIADEGGWWPLFNSNEEALETLTLAIEKAGESLKMLSRLILQLQIWQGRYLPPCP